MLNIFNIYHKHLHFVKKNTNKFAKEHFRRTLKFSPEILKNKTQWKHEGQLTFSYVIRMNW